MPRNRHDAYDVAKQCIDTEEAWWCVNRQSVDVLVRERETSTVLRVTLTRRQLERALDVMKAPRSDNKKAGDK